MTEIAKKRYPLNPTLRLVGDDGRATAEFFRILTAIGQILETVTVVPGEITTEMLADLAVQASKLDDGAVVIGKIAAGAIYVHTLFADEVVITSKVAPNAITELTAGVQVGVAGPNGYTVLSLAVPVSSASNTGVALTFTGVTSRPTSSPSNNGYWRIILQRNGVTVGITPRLFYDDNFAYPVAVSFVDPTPGTNPTYSILTQLDTGLGNFELSGGVLNNSLFKR